jgi:hypothetical protein
LDRLVKKLIKRLNLFNYFIPFLIFLTIDQLHFIFFIIKINSKLYFPLLQILLEMAINLISYQYVYAKKQEDFGLIVDNFCSFIESLIMAIISF